MKPRITVITIGVDDLERAVSFYKDGLGLPTEGIIGQEFEHGAVAFFKLTSGLTLSVFERKNIAHDTQLSQGTVSPTEFTLGHNVQHQEEVEQVIEEARNAGATIITEPHKAFWGGYSGYFQDPDGHLWEVVWNPDLVIKE